MDYILINVHCDPPFRDILIAEMGILEFDSFVETEVGFEAYIGEEQFSHPALQVLFNNYRQQTRIWYELKKIPKQNWNEEWEKNYDPIKVGNQIHVRATFHEADASFPYEIVINPKMSFGTGHHETTSQMLALQLEVDHKGKEVIDIGSGTGILAIMAAKLGANRVDATDIDEWCIENSLENFDLNAVKPGFVKKGVIADLDIDRSYDIVLANINTNILLAEMALYAQILKPGGTLMLSGFYDFDKESIVEKAKTLNIELIKSIEKNKWTAALFHKLA